MNMVKMLNFIFDVFVFDEVLEVDCLVFFVK